jgi:hypothetical protein
MQNITEEFSEHSLSVNENRTGQRLPGKNKHIVSFKSALKNHSQRIP